MPFDPRDGVVERAVRLVVLEEEDGRPQGDRAVVADGGPLPPGAHLRAVVGRHGDQHVGLEVQERLAAAAAGRDEAVPALRAAAMVTSGPAPAVAAPSTTSSAQGPPVKW
ncbi:hypothetical protein [Kitasatospora sp. NPDC088134]|uniref:hypothetical protein n=1 Tax=Kitasatospora sp. NPDC088134 TaxID=3364071 RepID=UPI0037F759F7